LPGFGDRVCAGIRGQGEDGERLLTPGGALRIEPHDPSIPSTTSLSSCQQYAERTDAFCWFTMFYTPPKHLVCCQCGSDLSPVCCLLFASRCNSGQRRRGVRISLHHAGRFINCMVLLASSSNRLGWRGSGPQSGEGWRTQPRNRDMRAMHRDPSPDRACSADRGPTKGSSLKVGVARRREGCPIVIAESAYSPF
jgi:hypothetical protein